MRFFNEAVIRFILMILQYCQDIGQITKRIQIIRLSGVRYAIVDHTGIRDIDTIDRFHAFLYRQKQQKQMD